MNEINPVGWFEIYVDDIERATKFYETVLNTALVVLPNPNDDMAMMTFPMSSEKMFGASGALVKMKGVKAGGNSTIVYFSSIDCSREEARIESAGGTINKSKTSIGEHGFMVLALDTEGNMIGIHSMK